MKLSTKVLSVIMSVCMLLSTFSIAISGEENSASDDEVVASLAFAAVSDIHLYPQSLTGGNCEAWLEYCEMEGKEFNESEALTQAALDSIAKRAQETGIKYLFIPGDLSKDSEYEAHVKLASMLEAFEEETGIEVFVTTGNHDINNDAAVTYENGYAEQARCITQAEFREVYKNLGYDHAYSEYVPPEGETQGGLSYAVMLDDNYMLIAADSSKYDAYEPSKDQTEGMISDGLMEWIKEMAAEAYESGRTPILMMHHSVAPHMKLEPSVTYAFCVDDYEYVAEQFADAGIHYVFTGHLHTNDISSVTSDSGETVYDCEVGSLTGFPNYIRELEITTYGNGESEMSYETLDVDYAHSVVVNGVEYEQPFSTASFAINYGGRSSDDGYADVTEFFMGVIKSFVLPKLDDIIDAGGINEYLLTMGIDLEDILESFLSDYIGDGVKIGNKVIFSVENIMWFIDDLFEQIEDLYLKDDYTALLDLCEQLITKIADYTVSDVPCTKFIDTYHFGDADAPGTLGDFILSAMYYWYSGNEDISDDAFVTDVLQQFTKVEFVEDFVDFLIDIVLNDVLEDAILSKINVRVNKLFNQDSLIGKTLGCTMNYFVTKFLRNDTSYQNLVDTIFEFDVLPYSSIYDILDQLLLQEYVTESQYESIGAELAYCAGDFVTDSNPQELGDNHVTYSTESCEVEATSENYRLPTMLSVTLGADSTSANINWFSKSTVTGCDIEIYKADEFTEFTGTPTTDADFTIEYSTQESEQTYYGIDFGVFGFFSYDFILNKHTVYLSDLEEGATYYYRVGDAEKGWWSETGTIETADGSDKVTFFHMSDPQSQTLEQYERSWANVVETAFELYPDAKFILNTGDLVDHGNNSYQWQWMFDSASSNLLNTYLMPATGNHEEKEDYATVNYFALSNLPEQDTASGVYYSFDYNNVHIMVLNSNDLGEDNALSDTQIEWLREDAASSDAQWKIVAIHKAVYSNGSHYDDDDVTAIRTQLSTLMPELDIDLVLQGHDHVYMRTYSLDSNAVTDSQRILLSYNGNLYKTDVLPTGTTYVISGTAGVKTYLQKDSSLTDDLFPRAEVIKVADASIFSAIQIDGGVLYFDSYKVDGDTVTKVDSFAIQKDTTQGEYAGDCEDVSAATQNSSSSGFFSFLAKIGEFIVKILNLISKITTMYFVE
ncbi:MAG: metallophosphoesterase [Clostridiales bacterium]|nr:metallophosphoesterase [Clostridiales bacterium]